MFKKWRFWKEPVRSRTSSVSQTDRSNLSLCVAALSSQSGLWNVGFPAVTSEPGPETEEVPHQSLTLQVFTPSC